MAIAAAISMLRDGLAQTIAERAIAKGIEQVVFDRGGYLYHGRIKALTDAARAAGLNKNEVVAEPEAPEPAAEAERASGKEVKEEEKQRINYETTEATHSRAGARS